MLRLGLRAPLVARNYRNKICSLIRLSKKSYYYELFKNNLNDMRKTWKRNLKPINKLKDPQSNNRVINDPFRLPNIINKCFSSVGNNLASKLPPAEHPYMDYLCNSKSPDTSFFFKPVTPHEVKLEILSMPSNKSYGFLVLHNFLNALVT